MDRYLLQVESSSENPKPIRRPRWKRAAIELNGRIESGYRRELSGLLIQSYSQIGVFPHLYHFDGAPCPTHMKRVMAFASLDYEGLSRRYGVSALEFDNQGIYLASVTKAGCLMVHDFESLYCQSNVISPWSNEDETKHLLHIPLHTQLDAVRWNPANQDEVVCASMKSNEIYIFDVAYVSTEPVEVLRKRPGVTIHGSGNHKGLSDVAFTSSDDSRVFACDTNGSINVWDRRQNAFPSMELTSNSHNALNCMQLDGENHIIYGAGKQGFIYMWDLRGGKTSAAFQSHKEAFHPPLTSVKISVLLAKIESLKAQSDIVPMDIHSISLDPSCSDRLAFHLDDGWSGILNINDLEVTHIHCPPPAWLAGVSLSSSLSFLRKPSWLSTNSLYAVGSSTEKGLHLLDFYPDATSPCHVDYGEDVSNPSRRNGFVPVSEDVTVCAAHPLNGFIVAGTKEASLLVIGQRRKSWLGEEGCGSSETQPEDRSGSNDASLTH